MAKNKDIAKLFAEGATSGNVKNLYIEGNVIFSYGNHFPVAIRLTTDSSGFKFIINSDKYSPTTSRHLSHVIRAIGDDNIIKRCSTYEMQHIKNKKFVSVKELMAEALE